MIGGGEDENGVMPQSVRESLAVTPGVSLAGTSFTAVPRPSGREKSSTTVIQAVARPFRSVPVVGSFVPYDGGHLDSIESALHQLHRVCLQ